MKIKRDKLFAIVCLVAAVVLYFNTGTIKVLANDVDPGAKLFPYLGEAMLVICSLLILLSKGKEEKEYLDKAGWLRLGVILGCLALYAVGLSFLGFLISTPIAMAVFIYILRGEEKAKPVATVVLALAVSFGLYFLFTKGFSIMLPKGRLF